VEYLSRTKPEGATHPPSIVEVERRREETALKILVLDEFFNLGLRISSSRFVRI
jgi:hypothetical protein